MLLPKKTGKDLVLIVPAKLEREDSKIKMSDEEMENLQRAQNRGEVIMVGRNVDDWEKGDFVSFYRNAATEVKEGADRYLSIHQGHILVAFEEK